MPQERSYNQYGSGTTAMNEVPPESPIGKRTYAQYDPQGYYAPRDSRYQQDGKQQNLNESGEPPYKRANRGYDSQQQRQYQLPSS
jgi:hypothetical protein